MSLNVSFLHDNFLSRQTSIDPVTIIRARAIAHSEFEPFELALMAAEWVDNRAIVIPTTELAWPSFWRIKTADLPGTAPAPFGRYYRSAYLPAVGLILPPMSAPHLLGNSNPRFGAPSSSSPTNTETISTPAQPTNGAGAFSSREPHHDYRETTPHTAPAIGQAHYEDRGRAQGNARRCSLALGSPCWPFTLVAIEWPRSSPRHCLPSYSTPFDCRRRRCTSIPGCCCCFLPDLALRRRLSSTNSNTKGELL